MQSIAYRPGDIQNRVIPDQEEPHDDKGATSTLSTVCAAKMPDHNKLATFISLTERCQPVNCFWMMFKDEVGRLTQRYTNLVAVKQLDFD